MDRPDSGTNACHPWRLALFVVVALSGCSPSSEAPLVVAERLFERTDPRQAGEARECAVGDEIRPALGCAEIVTLHQARARPDGKRPYLVGPVGRGRRLFVEKSTRSDRRSKWRPVAWRVIDRAPPRIALTFPPDVHRVRARGFVVPPPEQKLVSKPVPVRAGMVLQGGLALDPVIPSTLSAPVRFVILARAGEGQAVMLYERTLSPDDEAPRWHDYDLPLGRFAGRSVTFEFVTRVDGARAPDVVVVPLWSQPAVLAPTQGSGWNFVIVSLDTLRADHVGVYGASGGATPVLDALAESGARFDGATTTYPSTSASHMSLMTGLYPSVHEVYAPPRALDRRIPTLAELLAPAGYRTAAVTENGMIAARAGFLRGFDSYLEFKGAMPASASGYIDKVLDAGTRWLERHRNERFFLFLHTYQVHGPHNPPAEFDRFEPKADEGPLRHMHALYRGEILYADHEIQRLVDVLKSLGLEDRTVLVVTADHGEGFGEQNVVGHGHDLTQELLHVPLLIRAPGLARPGAHVASPVSLVDIAPTLLELAKVEIPSALQGQPLVAMLSGEGPPGDLPVYSEVRPTGDPEAPTSVAIRAGETKWIFPSDGGPPRVFDLSSGTDVEQREVPPEVLARGTELFRTFEESVRDSRSRLGAPRAGEIEVDDTTEHQLRALGYID